MEHLFFEALCAGSQQSANPLAQVLQRLHPGLTAWVAEDLVHNITPAERKSLENGKGPRIAECCDPVVGGVLAQNQGPWKACTCLRQPMRTAAQRSCMQCRRSTVGRHICGWNCGRTVFCMPARALSTARSNASWWLYPISTRSTSPWRTARASPTGSIGPFLEVLLAALPLAERQSLGYIEGAGEEELVAEVCSRLQRKWELAETFRSIGRRPHFHAPRRVADGRIGYPLSGRGLKPVERQQVARLRVLYPSATDEDVLQLWRDAGDSVRERDAMIDSLYRERETMNAALAQWLHVAPGGQARDARALAVERIKRCWAKEPSAHGTAMAKELNLDGLDLSDLPVLGAHFGHVEVLSLKNNQLSQLPQRFLRCFPGVTRVYLNNNRLEQLPVGLSRMPRAESVVPDQQSTQIQTGRCDPSERNDPAAGIGFVL